MSCRCCWRLVLSLATSLCLFTARASDCSELYCSPVADGARVNRPWERCWIQDPVNQERMCLPDPDSDPGTPAICCVPDPKAPLKCLLAPQPVLFVHGHDFLGTQDGHFERTWQQKGKWGRYRLPHFKETLEDNFAETVDYAAGLSIEPYYVAFHDNEKHRDIGLDAAFISEAVDKILVRHGDPMGSRVKVVIVAYSKGTISSRLHLRSQATQPLRKVSEHIAISPPNHGIERKLPTSSLALCQASDGYDDECNQLCQDGLHFMRCLNDGGETPGGRPAEASRNQGVHYVTLYDPDDEVGGTGGFELEGDCLQGASPPQCLGASAAGDCIVEAGEQPGRVRAENCGDHAVNLEVPEVPGFTGLVIHGNAVHTPELICKALYAATHHHAPPPEPCCRVNDRACGHEDVPKIPRDHPGVVLLLDVSGSMNRTVEGIDPPRTRLEVAREAADLFLTLLGEFGSEKSHYGVAVLPHRPPDPDQSCSGQARLLSSLVTGASVVEGLEALEGVSGRGNTPLLAGLEVAAEMLGSEERKAVVLLTDGYQNCPTVDAEALDETDEVKRLRAADIRVSAIGFGNHDQSFLQKLADATVGHFHDANSAGTPEELTAAFESLLASFLDLDETGFAEGTIGTDDVTDEITLTGEERRVVFVLSWPTRVEGRLQLEVLSSDGEEVLGLDGSLVDSDAVRLIQRHTFTVLSIEESFLSQEGKVSNQQPWATRIHFGEEGQETYRFGVLVDSSLQMMAAVVPPPQPLAAGDPITLIARLTRDGKPFGGNVEVTAEAIRPEDGHGNWFAAHSVSATDLETVQKTLDGDLRPRALRKSIFLTDERHVALPKRLDSTELTLNDLGLDGDAVANDGVFTGRFTETPKEGTYAFRVRAVGRNGKGEVRFEREQSIHQYLGVRPVATATEIEVKEDLDVDPGSRRFELRVVPRDVLGNYLGPGYVAGIRVEISQLETPLVTDRLDGSYDLTFAIDDQIDPRDVEIAVDVLSAKQVFTLDSKLRAWSLSLHLDRALPRGRLGNRVGDGLALGLHLERSLSRRFSISGLLGYRDFSGSTSARSDVYRWSLSGQLAYQFREGIPGWYLSGGPGVYLPLSGSARLGANLETGVDLYSSGEWTLTLAAAYHRVFKSGGDVDFVQAGARVARRF